ncbi:MAG: Penicillin-binding protein 1A [Lachnoclostridium sp.]|jgi:penicillin-binding protein 1A
MDFSKNGIAKKQRQIKSTSRKVASKALVSFFRVFLLGIVFLAIIGSYAGFGVLKGLIDSAPSIDQINVMPTGYTTNIYDKDGNLIETLAVAGANRVYVTIDEIPKVLQNCFIAIEDERFYEHNGIDIRGIFRAFFHGLSQGGNFDQGASTITQQLIKNQVFNGGAEDNVVDRMIRKIQEQYLAIQLEERLDKDSILEYYLNNINLGAGTYGVQTASKRYFNKDVSELNLSESAVIAAIAQSPTNMNPIVHPENNAKRRAQVLENMKRLGLCTEEEYEEAINDDVYARIESVNEEQNETSYYSYFVDELIEQVIEDLQKEKGYTYTQASNALYSGGLSIYTTLDSKIQEIVDDVYSNEDYFPEIGNGSYWELTYLLSVEKKDGTTHHYDTNDLVEYFKSKSSSSFSTYFTKKEDALKKVKEFKEAMVDDGDKVLGENTSLIIQPQSSMVIMDQHTGQVVALLGGRGEKTGNRTLNRATNTYRQPGSTFKVLSTYLPALDSAGMTLATTIDDAPYKYPDSNKYVSNWNRGTYAGLTTLREAITNSMNVVTVKTLAQVTPQIGFDYLTKLGFTSLVDSKTSESGKVYSDINLSLALGGITEGVSNLELTAAYAAIANGGIYIEPTFYTKILDHDNNILLENKPKERQVMKESTAYLLTSAMEDVVKKGTGTSVKFNEISMPVAGKTGTTSDDKDLWFAGYTPYYTATIWSGFDNNLTQTNKNYHKIIWRDIMQRIHEEYNLKSKPFEKPDSIVSAKICTKSGKLAVPGLCDKYVGGSTVKTEYFAKGTVPTEKCDIHVKVTICKDSGLIANEYCPESSLEEKVFLIKDEKYPTKDTPYLYPDKTCTKHNAKTAIIPNDIYIPVENDNTEEDLPNIPATSDDNGDDNGGDNTTETKPNNTNTNNTSDDTSIEYYYDNN